MDGFARATELSTIALNSEGVALQKFGTYQEGAQAKIEEFTNQWQIMSYNIMDADLLKSTIELGTGLLELGNTFDGLPIQIAGMVGSILVLKSAFDAFKGTEFGLELGKNFTKSINYMTQLKDNYTLLLSAQIKYQAMQAGLTTSTGILSLSQLGLAGSIKAVGLSLASMIPLWGWVAIAGAAVLGLKKIYDLLNVSMEEQKEIIANLKKEYSEAQSQIDAINAKLRDNKTIIDEMNKDGLNIVDKNTVKTLELENVELLKQLEIETRLLDSKKQSLEVESKKLLSQKNQSSIERFVKASPESVSVDVATNEQIRLVQKLTNELKGLDKADKNYEKKRAEIEATLNKTNIALSDNIKLINDNKQNLNSADPEQKKLIDNLTKIEDAYIALQTLDSNMDSFDEILNAKATSDQIEQLKELAREGELTSKYMRQNFGVLVTMFEAIGLSIDDVREKLIELSSVKPPTKQDIANVISAVRTTKKLEEDALASKEFLQAEEEYNEKRLDISNKFNELTKKASLESFKKTIDDRKKMLDGYNETSDILSLKLTIADESDFDLKIDTLSSQFANANDYGVALRREFELLANTAPNTAEEAQHLASRIGEVGSAIRSNITNVIDFNKQLTKMQISSIAQGAKNKADDLNLQIKMLERNMNLLEKGNLFDKGLFAFDYLLPQVSQSELDRVKSENQKIIDEQTRHQQQISEITKKATDMQMVENAKARTEERIVLNKNLKELEQDWDKTYREMTQEVRTFVDSNRELLIKFLGEEEFNKIFDNGKNLGQNLMDGIAEGVKTAKDNVKSSIKESIMDLLNGAGTNGSTSATEGSGNELTGQSLEKFFGGTQTSGFGNRVLGGVAEFHAGVDFGMAKGTPIKSRSNGKVVANGYMGGRGNTVVVKDKYGYEHWYQHMNVPSPLKIGSEVTAGSQIGQVGSTGRSTGNHLHYEILDAQKKVINPNSWENIIKNLNPRAKGGYVGTGEISLVGDEKIGEKRPELAIYPDGKIKVVGSDGAQVEKFPKGTQIIPHKESKDLLKKIPRYANGGVVGGDSFVKAQSDFFKKKDMLYNEVLAYLSMPKQDLAVKADIIERINEAMYESKKITIGLTATSLQDVYNLELSTAEKLFTESEKTTLTTERRQALSEELQQSLDRIVQYETQLYDIISKTVDLEVARVDKSIAYQKDDISNQDEVIKRMERKSNLAKTIDEQVIAGRSIENAYALKAESLQTSIFKIQKEIVKLQTDNAQYLGNFNTTSWFQLNGELTEKYRDDLNFVNDSERQKVEIFANTVSQLKKMSNSYSENLDNTIMSMRQALESESGKIVNMLDLELRALQAYADRETRRIDDIIRGLEDEKDALREANDEKKEALDLMRLEEALANAKSKRVKIYKEEAGGFVYEKDMDAIGKAQDDLNEYNEQKKYEDELDRIDGKIEAWQEEKQQYADLVASQKEKQDEMLLEMELGTTLEKFWESRRINNFSSFATAYKKSMDDLIQAQVNVNTQMQELVDDLKRLQREAESAKDAIDSADSSSSGTSKPPSSSSGGGGIGGVIGGIIGGIGSVIGGILNKKQGFASGTPYNPKTQLSFVGEKGVELRILNRGDGIVPNNLTKNLMDWGNYTPSTFLSQLNGVSTTSSNTTIVNQFDKLVLPNVTDGNSFQNELRDLKNFKNLAIQY